MTLWTQYMSTSMLWGSYEMSISTSVYAGGVIHTPVWSEARISFTYYDAVTAQACSFDRQNQQKPHSLGSSVSLSVHANTHVAFLGRHTWSFQPPLLKRLLPLARQRQPWSPCERQAWRLQPAVQQGTCRSAAGQAPGWWCAPASARSSGPPADC